MATPSLSFIAGLLVLLYLSTFVIFALLRIITGVSIQRLGYFGFRRISWTPREGVRVDIRGLGFKLHRPTFAQPTWISVVLTELKVTVDLKTCRKSPKRGRWTKWGNLSSDKAEPQDSSSEISAADNGDEGVESDAEEAPRSRTWEKLMEAKDRIKRLHRQIKWIRMVDLVATSSSFTILDIGTLEITSFTMAVDTRRKTVDRSRLFQHTRAKSEEQMPAEWIFTVRGVLFSPEGKESTEIIDHCTLNVHGLLYKDLDGLREASIALKLGRLSLPYDDIQLSVDRIRHGWTTYARRSLQSSETEESLRAMVQEAESMNPEDSIAQTVADSKEFLSSILRGIQEIQLAVSFFGLSKRLQTVQPNGAPVYLNMSMKELGLDLLRLDPRSPAHLMYFSSDDIAHQALIAAIAISVGIDDGQDHPERLLYIPMATATVKTTLPAKTIQISKDKNVAERNTNILFANLVVTSPSVDLDPRHLPLVLAVMQSHREQHKPSHKRSPSNGTSRRLLSRLLPKASVKISVHEPVIRVSLPPMGSPQPESGDFDLLISAMSSISLDVESSHSAGGELHYSLASNFRVARHQLYYQTANRDKHDLLMTDSMELKMQLSASPEVVVVATGNIQTFAVYMVRPEIAEGIRQIVMHLHSHNPASQSNNSQPRQTFLRRLPSWLLHVQLQGSDFNFEVAGVDPTVSTQARGVALHLESWTMEYKANKGDESDLRTTRRRAASRSIQGDAFLKTLSPHSPRRRQGSVTDGRRLALHTQGLEAFVVESVDSWDPEAFLSLPRFEVAFTTSSDNQGPVFHVNSFARSLFCHYSLYRHYAVGVAIQVLRKTFKPSPPKTGYHSNIHRTPSSPDFEHDTVGKAYTSKPEIVTYDFKANFVQIKATMPADPPLMLHIIGMEAGCHRWATPFGRARLMRLYTETPIIKKAWSRIISVKGFQIDYRQSRKKYGTKYIKERSIDIVTDAIRMVVPHQLIVYKILNNIANTVKTVKQLHHRFKTETEEEILDKEPEGPKRVPKISLRSQAFAFEIEDGSFEWRLGCIYRLGLLEQRQRLAREDAFNLKVKRLEELAARRGSSRRAKSAHHPRGRKPKADTESRRRSGSNPEDPLSRTTLSPSRGRQLRYDTEGTCGLSDSAHTTPEEAWEKLQQLNAQSWKRRIDAGLKFQHHAMKDIREMFWGADETPEDIDQKERIMSVSLRPALGALLISELSLTIDKPSFPLHEYPAFLHRVGKGMPFDMQYSLLIPMNVQVSMGEARITLRDYPLPLIHIPSIRPGQSPRLPSLTMQTDFVIAEEFRDAESIRQVRVVVVPPDQDASGAKSGGYAVNVRRTVSSVKTYSDMKFEINTTYPTRITWGTSYQPAIQDMMQVIESFTKPTIDPSERMGFWDKIRLTFHSRIDVAWKGDGDVHLILKGSRDPYLVTGTGAGFVMCWRNNVRWGLWQDDEPRKFMTVESGAYVLAIPDLSHYARQVSQNDLSERKSSSSTLSAHQGAMFKKTIMKLSGNVRWLAGLVFERNTEGGGRSYHFKPHYEVVLKDPKYVKPVDGTVYDAFRGFRSNHIHLSVAIAAPVDRDWTVTNLKPSANYNSVHLTPRFFSHFYSWWSMFSGVMSLPIRQGKLWPGIEKSTKKFGRHLATIKYSLLLSPLFLSHIYKHKDAEEFGAGIVTGTGLKVRLDSFMLDLHQRREEFWTGGGGNRKESKTSGMRINQVQLDMMSADIRAVSATISGTDPEDVENATDETLASYRQHPAPVDLANFTVPDNDLNWIDMDDFVELDWVLPAGSDPETKILPLAFAPRFTYIRQTDHGGNISGDPLRSSPFGNEPTHYCVMSARNDPRRVQIGLIEDRIERIKEQIKQNERAVGEQELKIVKGGQGNMEMQSRLEILRKHTDSLIKKQEFLQRILAILKRKLERDERKSYPAPDSGDEEFYEALEDPESTDRDAEGIEASPFLDYISDFNNRFIVHNAQVKWTNSLRNIILRYIHQVTQRRGFVYYMSRRAVKFILDIVEEQQRSRDSESIAPRSEYAKTPNNQTLEGDDELNVQSRINQLLEDGKKFVNANDPENRGTSKQAGSGNPGDDIAGEFTAQNAYHFRLIAPQIQLQSEKNIKSAILVTTKGMQLKVIQIMDRDRVSDNVSGLVQRRFTATMDSLQIFATSTKTFATEYLHMYSGNRYGSAAGSSWPPWVPLEIMFEYQNDPYGFSRVVQRTSASLRLDKYNKLRLKYTDDVTSGGNNHTHPDNEDSGLDRLWIDFPQIRAICDSAQYYAIYVIVLDLLLYNEPLEKVRSERLEKIMLASDFSDLTGAPEMVISLQERIRQLEEIKMHFQLNERWLDRQGWKDRISMEQDLVACEDELFFMMKAITTSQRRPEDRGQPNQSNGVLRWYITASQIVWHLVQQQHLPLAEFQLKNVLFDRMDNNDGSNHNYMEIERIHGLNLLPDAVYPDMIGPFYESSKPLLATADTKMLRVQWLMLEAIAGIPVMDRFEVNLFPLRVQLEREVGKRLFEYIFPGAGDTGGSSPFMIKHKLPSQQEEGDEGDEEEAQDIGTPSTIEVPIDNSADSDALQLRLQPTLNLPDKKGSRTSIYRHKYSSHSGRGDLHPLRFFNPSERTPTDLRKHIHTPRVEMSPDSQSLTSRPPSYRTSSNMSSTHGSSETEKSRRFTLHRADALKDRHNGKGGRSDDLSQMMVRASNYMTLAHVKVPSVVLCLSYKGKGQRNFEDVHDLVFRMPTLEYRNKTWSNLDLALQLKKDVIRALISHTGAIIGNKFSHHRASKHQSRLREMTNTSLILGNTSTDVSTVTSETDSTRDVTPPDGASGISEPRASFTSGRGSTISGEASLSSSMYDQNGSDSLGINGTSMSRTISRGRSTAAKSDKAASIVSTPYQPFFLTPS